MGERQTATKIESMSFQCQAEAWALWESQGDDNPANTEELLTSRSPHRHQPPPKPYCSHSCNYKSIWAALRTGPLLWQCMYRSWETWWAMVHSCRHCTVHCMCSTVNLYRLQKQQQITFTAHGAVPAALSNVKCLRGTQAHIFYTVTNMRLQGLQLRTDLFKRDQIFNIKRVYHKYEVCWDASGKNIHR